MAYLGVFISGESLARKFLNGELTSTGLMDIWTFLPGPGGLIGLAGFWCYSIWRIRLPRRARTSERVISLLPLIGVITALSLLLPGGLEGLLDNTLLTAPLILMTVTGLYTVVDMQDLTDASKAMRLRRALEARH